MVCLAARCARFHPGRAEARLLSFLRGRRATVVGEMGPAGVGTGGHFVGGTSARDVLRHACLDLPGDVMVATGALLGQAVDARRLCDRSCECDGTCGRGHAPGECARTTRSQKRACTACENCLVRRHRRCVACDAPWKDCGCHADGKAALGRAGVTLGGRLALLAVDAPLLRLHDALGRGATTKAIRGYRQAVGSTIVGAATACLVDVFRLPLVQQRPLLSGLDGRLCDRWMAVCLDSGTVDPHDATPFCLAAYVNVLRPSKVPRAVSSRPCSALLLRSLKLCLAALGADPSGVGPVGQGAVDLALYCLGGLDERERAARRACGACSSCCEGASVLAAKPTT